MVLSGMVLSGMSCPADAHCLSICSHAPASCTLTFQRKSNRLACRPTSMACAACIHTDPWQSGAQVEGMEAALDEDTQAALEGIVGEYQFSNRDLRTFEELVGTASLGLLACPGPSALKCVSGP